MDPQIIAAYITGLFGVMYIIITNNYQRTEESVQETRSLYFQLSLFIQANQEFLQTLKSDFQQISEADDISVEDYSKLQHKIQSLDHLVKTGDSIYQDMVTWKKAGIWLGNNKEWLVKKTIKNLKLKRKLESNGADINRFRESLLKHLLWVEAGLKHATIANFDIIHQYDRIDNPTLYEYSFKLMSEILISKRLLPTMLPIPLWKLDPRHVLEARQIAAIQFLLRQLENFYTKSPIFLSTTK